jgi:hypothetical protein
MIVKVRLCAGYGFNSSPTNVPRTNEAFVSVSTLAVTLVFVPPANEIS